MITAKKTPFDEAVENLMFLSKYFTDLPGTVKERTQEIRLRSGQFITLELGTDRLRLNVKVTSAELEELLKSFCNYSLYSYSKQLSEGFITLEGGHRAGFAGTAVTDKGSVTAIRDITSINLRIAKEYKGCSDKIYDLIFGGSEESFKGLLIAGCPVSAKTTVLRDLIRNISETGKITVIDERGELAAKCSGYITNDLGPNADVLCSFPKAEGFIAALRALSPEYIACDEIGQDSESILKCVNSGVKLILTAHSSGMEEASVSPMVSEILATGGISHAVFLGTGRDLGKIKSMWKTDGRNTKTDGKNDCGGYICCGGYVFRNVPVF